MAFTRSLFLSNNPIIINNYLIFTEEFSYNDDFTQANASLPQNYQKRKKHQPDASIGLSSAEEGVE